MSDRFIELMQRSVTFNLSAIKVFSEQNIKDLHESASTVSVKTAQMLGYQKVILAVGMFSIFEAQLQGRFNSENTFAALKTHLKGIGEIELQERFELFNLAINSLKHGEGNSHKKLLSRNKDLPFKVKKNQHDFFFEGDVAEPHVLIDVDDQFVLDCVELIEKITKLFKPPIFLST